MKKLFTLTIILSTSLLFTACGSGGSGSTGSSSASSGTSTGSNTQQQATSKVVPLHIGEATAIKAGYAIVDSNDEAVLDILVAGETKTVILKSGTASLKMPI